MERQLEKLKSVLYDSNIDVNQVVPDGRVHSVGENQFYIAYSSFSSRSGEPYFVLVYGDLDPDQISQDFCTLKELKTADRTAVADRLKQAKRTLQRFLKIPEGDVPSQDLSGLFTLGFSGPSYFFTSTQNQQIVEITAFSEKDFLSLMPLSFWETQFPGSGAAKVSWTQARSQLMQLCRQRGLFESRRVRGAGVWMDAGRVVVNMGDHLVVDGAHCPLLGLESDFFYTLGRKLPTLHEKPLTADECQVITEACELFRWQKSDFGYLLAGALVTTRLCGALPIRPHVWVTGSKGTGKTTLFNRLIQPLLGRETLFLAGSSTEAGIRQRLRADSIPVLFDEFENNGPKSEGIVQSVLDLMRVAWSDTQAVVLKGSSAGTSQEFSVKFAAIVTSIRQVSLNDADQSRFATIELAPHASDMAHWNRLDALLNTIDFEFGNRLFARTVGLLPVLLANSKAMNRALNRKSPGQRFGDQYGMLLAGYSLLLSDEPMDDAQADLLASHVTLEDAREAAGYSDEQACLDTLLTKKITLQVTSREGREERIELSVAQAIHASKDHEAYRGALETYGILCREGRLCIRTRHTELENLVYKGTRWSHSWAKALIRLRGAEHKKAWITQKTCDSISLPLDLLN